LIEHDITIIDSVYTIFVDNLQLTNFKINRIVEFKINKSYLQFL